MSERQIVKAPHYHYQQAAVLMDEIVKRKDDENFNEASASLLLQSAQAHFMAGILSVLMEFRTNGFD